MCASKWKSHFPPKPPPSVGTITRTSLSGNSSVLAIPERAGNGACVELQTVTLSPAPLGQGAVRLDRDRVRHVRLVSLGDHQVCLGQGALDVALDLGHERARVAFAEDRRAGSGPRPIRVHERRPPPQCRLRVEHRLERLVLHPDPAAGLGGCLLGQGGDRGDHLALEADNVAGEQRPVA